MARAMEGELDQETEYTVKYGMGSIYAGESAQRTINIKRTHINR